MSVLSRITSSMVMVLNLLIMSLPVIGSVIAKAKVRQVLAEKLHVFSGIL
jgi:hypothetical protein